MGKSGQGELPGIVRGLFPAGGAFPLGLGLTIAVRGLARRRPELFDRLGEFRAARYLVAPSDLDFAFLIVPDGEHATVRTVSARHPQSTDVAVRGPLLMLIGLLDGTLDGDALFFHRLISVEGRTDALVALRNTLEDAALRPSDLLGFGGGLGRLADSGVEAALNLARRLSTPRGNHRDNETGIK